MTTDEDLAMLAIISMEFFLLLVTECMGRDNMVLMGEMRLDPRDLRSASWAGKELNGEGGREV